MQLTLKLNLQSSDLKVTIIRSDYPSNAQGINQRGPMPHVLNMSSFPLPDDFSKSTTWILNLTLSYSKRGKTHFRKIRRSSAEKIDPIGLRSCFTHLTQAQVSSEQCEHSLKKAGKFPGILLWQLKVRKVEWCMEVAVTAKPVWQTTTKILRTCHNPESFLDWKSWSCFDSHCTSMDDGSTRPEPQMPVWDASNTCWNWATQKKLIPDDSLPTCPKDVQHLKEARKTFLMFWNLFPSWEILQRRSTCAQ